nr:SIR2 family protein [Priestia megaterium]
MTPVFQIINSYLNNEPKSIKYHKKLAEIPQIKQIVTTNYDDLFERAYKNSKLSVILENSQIPLANKPVKLYKIHGDMSHPNSVVLTTSHYNNFFSFKNQNQSLWNKVTSLADETSFVFLGYSLEDPNAKQLIDKLVERVGEFRHENFLVSPNLPEYKVQNLNKKGITYINMTGEEFIDTIYDEIIPKIVEDYEAGFLQPAEVDELLQKRDIEAKFEYKKGKSSIVEFGSKNGDEPLNLKFDLTHEEHNSFINFLTNDIENQELEIDGQAISNIISEYKGIHFPPFDSSTEKVNVRFIKHPDRILEGNLVIKETDEVIEDIKVHVFKTTDALRIKFIHESFTIQTIIKKVDGVSKQTLNISFEHSGNLAKDYKVSTFLQNWFVNGHTMIFNNFTDKTVVPLQSPKDTIVGEGDQGVALKDLVNSYATLYKKLFEIQNHFGVYLTVPEKFYKKDEEALNQALMAINKQKHKVESFNVGVSAENNKVTLNNFLENESLPFKHVINKAAEVTVFGQKINLGYSFIETLDGYLENRDEVSKQLEQGVDMIDLVIKSKSDEMYFGYQETDGE